MIRNFLLNPEDYVRSDHIYGPDRPLIQGGMKLYRNPVNIVPKVSLPKNISLHHNNIELYLNFYMYIIPFLHKESSKITILTGRGSAQDVPFGIIIWYIAKTVPTLLE